MRAPKIGHFRLVLFRDLDQILYLIVMLDHRGGEGFYNPSETIESLVNSHSMLLALIAA